MTYVKSDTHSADGHQSSSDDEASDSEAEEPRKSGSTATRSYHTGRTPNDEEEEFQFDEVSAPAKKRRVITEDSDDE